MTIFKRFDHIGIVVRDLKKATKALAHFFGSRVRRTDGNTKGRNSDGFLFPWCLGQMELIEFQRPLDDLDPVVTRPGAGVQHVAWQVENFEETLKELTDKGLKVVKGFPRKGAHGKVAFFYPPEGLDLMVEICEVWDRQAK